jgi:hypothetical protein
MSHFKVAKVTELNLLQFMSIFAGKHRHNPFRNLSFQSELIYEFRSSGANEGGKKQHKGPRSILIRYH